MNDDPANQRVDYDGDQREELDLDALEARGAREALEHPWERLCDEIDQAGESIFQVGRHQLKQGAQLDLAVQHAEGQLDQSSDAAQGLLADGIVEVRPVAA